MLVDREENDKWIGSQERVQASKFPLAPSFQCAKHLLIIRWGKQIVWLFDSIGKRNEKMLIIRNTGRASD